MLTSETTIRTTRPGRYLAQFCRHAAAMGNSGGGRHPHDHSPRAALAQGTLHVDAEHSGTRGVVTISPWGRCTLRAGAGTLAIRVDATDEDAMRQIQDIVTRDLERFGRRDGLAVHWPPPAAADADDGMAPPLAAETAPRTGRPRAILVSAVIAVAIALHLAFGAAILANTRWLGASVDVILVVALIKSLLIAFGGRRLRARARLRTHGHVRTPHHDGPSAANRAGDHAPADEHR